MLSLVKDLTRSYMIDIFAIVELRVSGERAVKRIIKTRFKASVHVYSI